MFDPPDPPDYGDEEPSEYTPVNMSDAETAAWIRTWCASPQSMWSWPTDACGYDQHMKFVRHRNNHFKPGDDFKKFTLAYADSLDVTK